MKVLAEHITIAYLENTDNLSAINGFYESINCVAYSEYTNKVAALIREHPTTSP